MAVKYHINPATGRPNQCTATVRDCKYTTNGETPEHYDTKEEARTAAEKTLSKEYGSTSTLKRNPSSIKLTNSAERKILLGLTDEPKSNKQSKPKFEEPTRIQTKGYTENSWIGSRREAYDEQKNGYLGAKEVATNIRQDLKNAVKAGHLPSDLKYSITTDKFAGGFAIRTIISGMGDVYDTHEYSSNRFGLELKPENQEVLDKIQTIQDGWNYNDSDARIDYFNSGFYNDIRATTPYEEAYTAYDKSRKAFNKLLSQNKEQGNGRTTEIIEAEKDYFEKLHNVTQKRELEKELFETARKYERKPDKAEYEKIKELSDLRAQMKVIESKKKYGVSI